ncbi:hypothetical protein SAMN05660653_00625 [Desulfonatronum thiosulfatophilum]|uniref:Uncharacterized protein n=1 Tax=Desulfonatronum thiosulfatophilum TaxID=617002 RepID=A0A1G6AWM1_9BACT|nr:hypothetical protein [Desulfonatronum thiosulfatophilum]SDB12817.1 hypothetical protein SAMN05660653_00625 [Desulfonatronum thiosulfatophilum]
MSYKVDLNNMPPLIDEQNADLKALFDIPDSEIDCSDIPLLDDALVNKVACNPFYNQPSPLPLIIQGAFSFVMLN